jgi:hypothetical protein
MKVGIVLFGFAVGALALACMRQPSLPHRPLHEIDVQGHMPPMHGCEAVYDAPDGRLMLCMGEVTVGKAGVTVHQ